MKVLIYSLLILSLAGIAIPNWTQAVDDSVTGYATVLFASISLDQTTFDYGSINANTASNTLQLFSGLGIIATNNGTTSTFDVYGANSTGGGTGWTLAGNTTGNNYKHMFCNERTADCSTPPTSYTALTAGTQTLEATISNAATTSIQLQITTPTTPTDMTRQSAPVTIQATAI